MPFVKNHVYILKVAVDRILESLVKLDFKAFVRVGSLRKMAKLILPFAAQELRNRHEGKLMSCIIYLRN